MKSVVLAMAIASFACTKSNGGSSSSAPSSDPAGATNVTFQVTSSAFENGATIPTTFTCDGDDTSPALSWATYRDVTGGKTKSFALIVDDPDAPGGTFTHWVLFDVSTSAP